jgi:hypothetical protein
VQPPSSAFMRVPRQGPATLSGTQQLTSNNEQIGETTCDTRPMGVLRRTPVAYLGEAEHSLDHPMPMLDIGTYPGLPAALSPLHLIHHVTLTVASIDEVSCEGWMLTDHSLLAVIRQISVDPCILAVRRLAQHIRIVHIGSGRRHGVDQLDLAVRTDMQLHAIIPRAAPRLRWGRLLRVWRIFRSRASVWFLVEHGAEMIVVLTIVSPINCNPEDAR